MHVCPGIKRDGRRCKATVEPPQTHCWWHDPNLASKRSELASKAASAKKDVEIGTVKRRLKEVAEGVLNGSIDKGRGSVAAQTFGVLIRAIEVERRIWETEALAEQVEEIMERLGA